MRIEKITKREGNNAKFSVIFDNEAELKVNASQIADFGLYSGKELSEEEFSKLVEGLGLSASKARAIRILGSRNMSAREIRKRLISKGDAEDTADAVVGWLEDIGAINDVEYAGSIVKHYSEKGYGVSRIRNELFRRGISRDLWDDALGQLGDTEDPMRGFLEKRLRGSTDKDDLRRATDALCRRGFGYEEARAAVRRYVEESGGDA